MLEIGSKAPDFELKDQNAYTHRLKDYLGKKVVLYFYPKDNTSGCTNQANGFNELFDEFVQKNTVIIGISKDTVASHKRFADKNSLKFTILSDEELDTIKAYDVWKEKKNYGKTYMGIERSTYIIDENGVIEKAFEKVKSTKNPQDMLSEI